MQGDWIKSPSVRRVFLHWADARPAWLWSHDGETLLWRNDAARYFHGKLGKRGVKRAPEAVPIRGQIARLIRLGTIGRSSLSRLQLLAGDRPISTTCTCTPLELADGAVSLLIVGVDPIEPELLGRRAPDDVDEVTRSLFPRGAEFLLISEDGQVVGGTTHALAAYAPEIESEGLPDFADGQPGVVSIGGEQLKLTRFRASPHDALLLLFEPQLTPIDRVRHADGLDADARDEALAPPRDVDLLSPLALPQQPLLQEPEPEMPAATAAEDWVEPIVQPEPPPGTLASLFDQLANDEGLYTTLTSADETFTGPPPAEPPDVVSEATASLPPAPADELTAPPSATGAETESVAGPAAQSEAQESGEDGQPVLVEPFEADSGPVSEEQQHFAQPVADAAFSPPPEPSLSTLEQDAIAAIITADADADGDGDGEAADLPETAPTLWRIVGRGFSAIEQSSPTEEPAPSSTEAPPDAGMSHGAPPIDDIDASEASDAAEMPEVPDPETVERVSRYNFDELSRILIDRVSAPPTNDDAAAAPVPVAVPAEGALISLAGETFILNRLPLGIMVFRDQHVLFANRALTELTGYDTIEALRSAGLSAIFPAADGMAAGPVTQLLRRNGTLVSVAARLQSINWHGRPALMLSASLAEERIGHEGAVRHFAELSASLSEEGFITLDRAGIIAQASLHARILLGMDEVDLLGRAVAALLPPSAQEDLRRFLDLPARFAETERPSVVLDIRPDLQLVLFTEGQAGLVQGYFGFLRKVTRAAGQAEKSTHATPSDDLEPSMLVRISRGIRRPLNTVIGFADLLRSPGADPGRQQEYARDIGIAGQEIATLVDELDDFARLREGRYPLEATEIELTDLLDNCLARTRPQATAARVLVRSSVSESLPRVSADRASLTQAVLNLLASAIDQTPPGGTVILSAQREDNGTIAINLRDTGAVRTDLGERFVVFRDGVGRQGEALRPVRSSVGLALTRSLLAVNAVSLSVDPAAGVGNLFSLLIPASLIRQ